MATVAAHCWCIDIAVKVADLGTSGGTGTVAVVTITIKDMVSSAAGLGWRVTVAGVTGTISTVGPNGKGITAFVSSVGVVAVDIAGLGTLGPAGGVCTAVIGKTGIADIGTTATKVSGSVMTIGTVIAFCYVMQGMPVCDGDTSCFNGVANSTVTSCVDPDS